MARVREVRPAPALGRLWLLASITLVALPHLWRLPWWLAIGAAAVLAWRYQHEVHGRRLPHKRLLLLITVLAISGVGTYFDTLFGREAGVALLTVLVCLKLLELRGMRDALFVLFLGYFLVISNFLFSTTILAGGYMFLVVLGLTASLVVLNHPGAQPARWRFYLGYGGRLLLQAIPLMIVLFLLFPRLSGPLWNMPKQHERSLTGLSDSMDIGNINDLASSDAIAFRVRFDQPIPEAKYLYWRGPVFWETNGRSWKPLRRRFLSRPSYDMPEYAFDPVGSISYDVILEPHGKQWLFALDLPATLPRNLDQVDVLITRDFQLETLQPINARLRYPMRSNLRYQTGELEDWEFTYGLQLPDANPRTRALGRQWRNQGLSDRAIVDRALALFRDEPFYYTRRPPLLGNDPLDRFLFDSRRGFCEHYAASFTYLMRAAGIPARVVAGYQGGEANAVGDYLIVRQARAHAWSEVWLDDTGWLRVDPTAVIPPERVEDNTDLGRFSSTANDLLTGALPLGQRFTRQLEYLWDAIDYQWNLYFLGFDKNRQAELMRSLGLDRFGWEGMVTLLGGLVAAILGGLTALTLWQRRGRDPVVRLYQRFQQRLTRVGLVRDPAEAPTSFAARVAAARPELKEAVNAVTALYLRLRYGRRARPADLQQLRQAVRRFRP